MHTEKREDPLVELGYEVRDLNTVAIRNAVIGFFIFAAGSAIIGFICYRLMNPSVFENAPATTSRMIPKPPNPLIQTNVGSKTDIMDIRQHETSVLDAPIGWTDASKTHLHIPIDQAMDIIAKRGVPATGAQMPAVSKGHTPDAAIGEKPTLPKPQLFGGSASATPPVAKPSPNIKLDLSVGAKPMANVPGNFKKTN